MRTRFTAIVLISTALMASSASATVFISSDNGGKMEDYAERFRKLRNSGESVVIDGNCMSACTMVLGMIPRDRICATPNAVLGFHAAWEITESGKRVASASGTRELIKTYPTTVRAWIARRGGLTANMMFLRGRDLAAVIRPCGNASAATTMSHPGSESAAFLNRSKASTSHASFGAR